MVDLEVHRAGILSLIVEASEVSAITGEITVEVSDPIEPEVLFVVDTKLLSEPKPFDKYDPEGTAVFTIKLADPATLLFAAEFVLDEIPLVVTTIEKKGPPEDGTGTVFIGIIELPH